MVRLKVGVQLHPQAAPIDDLRAAWRAADAHGFDSIWLWDHFFPLYGEPDAEHYEAYTLLAAMALDTTTARFGALVTCNSYRNPHLLADMSRNLALLSGGRFVLGLGSGWFERDYTEYDYEFGTAASRLRDLEANLLVIRARLGRLNPPPPSRIPVLIGGGGEKVTLRLVAEHADLWNGFGPPDHFAHKGSVLDDWCTKVGRDPASIERTVNIGPDEVANWEAYAEAGAQHLIVMCGAPYDLSAPVRLLEHARS